MEVLGRGDSEEEGHADDADHGLEGRPQQVAISMQRFANLDCPLLVGASRKSFIWKTLGLTAEEALEGSLALAVLSRAAGAHILRVHDVQASCRALRVADAVLQAEVES